MGNKSGASAECMCHPREWPSFVDRQLRSIWRFLAQRERLHSRLLTNPRSEVPRFDGVESGDNPEKENA
jgi:hypothetical protein